MPEIWTTDMRRMVGEAGDSEGADPGGPGGSRRTLSAPDWKRWPRENEAVSTRSPPISGSRTLSSLAEQRETAVRSASSEGLERRAPGGRST